MDISSSELISGLVNQLPSAAVGAVAAWGVFKWLGSKWIENRFNQKLQDLQHQHDRELQRLRIKIDSTLNGALKLQEREFEVLPELWDKLRNAMGIARSICSPVQLPPDLGHLSSDELIEFLSHTDLSDSQRQKVSSAKPFDRTRVYTDIAFFYRVGKLENAVGEFKGCYQKNRIFIRQELKTKIDAVLDSLNYACVVLGLEYGQKKTGELNGKFDAVDHVYETIAQLISERLHSHGELNLEVPRVNEK